jgi:opacity protein-like surface antigen
VFRKFVFSSAASAAALVFIVLPASAQRAGVSRPAASSIAISPYAGYITFGTLVNGPLSTSLHSAASPVYGAQVNLPLTSVVSILGNIAYTEPDLRAGIPIIGDVSVGKSSVWLYDAGLQLSAPGYGSGDRGIFPFVQAGVGAMRYDVQISGLSRTATNAAFTAGIGADIPLAPSIGIRLAARDYIGKFDFNQAASLDVTTNTTNNVALSAGIKLGF